ncbi:GntR family transcriptional regulator [Propionispora vibrioides]|uniref:GntR family transcriptional regulator n=1 Tax=Propionispora vibrioides TaxID=112903 RepID=A0A1H8T5I8_9FIRM|nr:GntR family transcriptional regulator [Propionispora vibrioides]SEO86191.1 GntR family transcriptional regulator [Propionispora vibrioides]
MEKNPALQGTLVDDNGIPLYYQLVSIIKRNITSAVLKPGDLLPSEVEFMDSYKISRSTVRQAFGSLEEDGLVIRRRGKGTYVAKPKLRRKLDNVYSFSNDMIQQGLKPDSKVIRFANRKVSRDLMKGLKIRDSEENIFEVVRVRMANGEPLLLETTFIPSKFCPYLTKEMLEHDSLYRILKDLSSIEAYYAVETYQPIILKKYEAELLQCKPGMSGYFVERISYLETEEIFEMTQSIVRSDRCKYEVKLYKDSIMFSRTVEQ